MRFFAAAVVLMMMCLDAGLAQEAVPNPAKVEVDFFPLPEGGRVFSAILAHSNGKVYVGASYRVARLVEFDPPTRAMRVVARMTSQALEGGGPDLEDPLLKGDRGTGSFPETQWKFAQDKIHTQLHEGADGRVYGGTHTKVEDPGSTRAYGGGHWFAYDPKTEKVEDLGWARRHEGIISACYDRGGNVLYGLTWPTGYLVSCKPDERDYARRLQLLGLASSQLDCVSRYLGVVKDGRVYMADGATGDIRVYVPGQRELHTVLGLTTPTTSPEKVPDVLRAGPAWRNWWFAGARSPDGMHLFTTGQRGGHLTEIDATQGQWGVVIDHGRTVPWGQEESPWAGPWCGGMVFGKDGLLYHTVGARLLTYSMKDHHILDWGETVLASDTGAKVALGGGTCGADGVLYFYASHRKTPGVVALDPARLKDPKLLRVSKRVILRPLAERGLMLP